MSFFNTEIGIDLVNTCQGNKQSMVSKQEQSDNPVWCIFGVLYMEAKCVFFIANYGLR